jgi:hypothetical protein
MCLIGLVDPGLCGRIKVHAHRSFVIGIDRHALQTQFPPARIELENSSQFHFPSSHSVSTMAAATNPIATPIKGLSTANQKEMFQSELLVGFVFMLFLKHSKIDISQNVNFLSGCLERGTTETVPRRGAFFPYLATILRRSVSDSTSCDHALPFITSQ